MNGYGLEDSEATKERRKARAVVLRSSQVNVLQTEQQSAGDEWVASMGGRGQVTRGILSPETALSFCPDVGRIWVLG